MRQQRRVALEQEVAELKQQLCNEETVHHILERALQGGGGQAVAMNIPAFIPGKAKELLAELVLVEQEIARLESQIHQMKGGLTTMQQQQQRAAASSNAVAAAANVTSTAAAAVPSNSSNGSSPRTDIRSMFFITQAMDGEYLKRHLADDKDRIIKHNNNVLGLPPRHSHDSNNKNNNELPIIKTRPGTTKVLQPNKLSERILKCLVCIFIRLLRSSRVAELDKEKSAGNSFSFRIDTGLNVATSNVAKDKDRGQQDHYAIFAIQDAIVRDIGPYKNLVRFTSSSFDLRGFSSSPLLTKLRGMLEALQQLDLRFLNHHQKLAFWLNIYNTCIMHGILQHGLPSNSEKLLALKNKATINVSGQMFNALVIENFILRQPSSVKELRIYKADRVVADLEKAKLEYLQASLVVTSTRRLMIPGLIHSNMHDFAKDMESLVRWICEQLPTSWSLRKSMVDCLRRGRHVKVDDVVDVIPLDYEFQYLLPMM
ncbi:hypothetical protein PR202_ga14242 [Eleusine coracana subsp. coracana]|uniref:DUF547 domain-containing protein n=1 Tax=Eleusine coracana subsp. coracana TaxID=191504 RepID=A0AAV5CGA3_ELECO|nr:hypothetical protein PR202_ga14242 [Eleusine coracana subsp. coracana]